MEISGMVRLFLLIPSAPNLVITPTGGDLKYLANYLYRATLHHFNAR